MDLAPPVDRQVIGLLLNPGRNGFSGKRLNATMIKRRYDVITPDPFHAILEESDSLMLSPHQADMLQDLKDKYSARRDTILTALADYLAGLADHYVARDAAHRHHLHFVIRHSRRVLPIFRGIDLKVTEERRRFALQRPDRHNRPAADFLLGALASTQLE